MKPGNIKIVFSEFLIYGKVKSFPIVKIFVKISMAMLNLA